MPDWSYQPLFRPLLFRLPAQRARDLTLGSLDLIARLPLGSALIELLGHMRPPESLSVTVAGLTFPTPVGLDPSLASDGLGITPLSQFGLGYIEVGPVTLHPVTGQPLQRLEASQSIWYPSEPVNPGLVAVLARLQRAKSHVPVGVRIAVAPQSSAGPALHECQQVMQLLAPYVSFYTLETRHFTHTYGAQTHWAEYLTGLCGAATHPVFISLAPDLPFDRAAMLVETALRHDVAGVVISGGIAADDGRLDGPAALPATMALLQFLRGHFGPQLPLVAGSGIAEPADALALLAAGATLVGVGAGMVYAGPGLPKRINEAVACQKQQAEETLLAPAERSHRGAERGRGWLPAVLMAWGIFIGAILASWVALTRVVLPYDEHFVGLTRVELSAINGHLLAFLTHDRISLAGIMLASSVLYLFIAYYAWRGGEHWARTGYVVPAALGFVSFVLFPFYGYFEPLHALLFLVLLPFFLALVRHRRAAHATHLPTSLHNDRIWLLGQWGQLLWITLAVSGIVAGLTITGVGLTRVFVPEDLGFMQTSAATFQAVPHLMPLIAHDRVGVGTNLVCNGLVVLLMSLWGYRRGARWMWWAFALAGIPSYAAAFGVHLAVGYINLWHLTPPFVGLLFLLAALICSYRYLCDRAPAS